MNWTQLSFGKHEGKTLPQVMFEDADWFFDGYEKGYFKYRLPLEAVEIYRRSRSIRVPQQDGQRMLVEYIIHKPNGKFGTMHLIKATPGLQHLYVSPLIDFYVPKAQAGYDKLGYKNFVFALKGILFGDPDRDMTKVDCEKFFNDDDNFDLAYAARNFQSRYDGLLPI